MCVWGGGGRGCLSECGSTVLQGDGEGVFPGLESNRHVKFWSCSGELERIFKGEKKLIERSKHCP